MEKLKKLFELVRELIERKFTGSITIHFSQGGIAKIDKNESLRV